MRISGVEVRYLPRRTSKLESSGLGGVGTMNFSSSSGWNQKFLVSKDLGCIKKRVVNGMNQTINLNW